MTRRYLQLNSSLAGPTSVSSTIASELVAKLRAVDKAIGMATELAVRDLASEPLPHLTADRFGALATPASSRTPQQAQVAAQSDALVAELQAADVLVIAAPMYNFGIPSTLKAWLDHVARAGVTFRYTESGPQGLLNGKKAWIVATRGGRYSGTPQDHHTPYLRQILGFMGIVDVEFIYAEGLALGEESRNAAIRAASERLEQLPA